MKKLRIPFLLALCQFSSSSAVAQVSLQEVLRYALNDDPRVYEAKANIEVAREQTEISKAGHYPVFSVVNTQMVSQQHSDSRDNEKSSYGLHGTMNLYSWGGVNSSIERDEHKHAYYEYKLGETREQLGQTIGALYLTALRAKESIKAYQKSLARHKKMLEDVKIIAQHDEGRAFESTEVQSRMLSVESTIADYQRTLQTTLSQLNRYSAKPIKAEDIVDPFANSNVTQFVQRYRDENLQNNPTYQAQSKELDSARASVDVAKANRLPAVNLESDWNNHGYAAYLSLSWNFFDEASRHTQKQSEYTENAAIAKLKNIMLEVQEQARTAEVEMRENTQRLVAIRKQITAQRAVVENYELQFQIAQRSLLDVLNSYQELTAVEIAEISAKNDFRDASLSYLVSQSKIANWAGVTYIHIPAK